MINLAIRGKINMDNKKKNINILKVGYRPFNNPKNLTHNIKNFFHTINWARQRILYGSSDWDIWDFDEYLANMLYFGLNHLADVTHGYPGHDEGDTAEGWDKILRTMAQKFYNCNENNDAYPTPKFNNYLKQYNINAANASLDDITDPEQLAAIQAWIDEDLENTQKRNQDKDDAMDALKYWFFDLWD